LFIIIYYILLFTVFPHIIVYLSNDELLRDLRPNTLLEFGAI